MMSSESEKMNAIPFTKLFRGKKEIKQIFHLSDIHIRNTRRHREYKEVFARTFDKIKNLMIDAESSLIVVTGDIVHAKTELSPEAVSLTYHFFKGLSEITTVILIPGNHDCNLSNRDRMDALTPIVEEIGHFEKLHYLKNSGYYQYSNIIFGVTSIYDDLLIPANKFDQDIWKRMDYKRKYKIALYHGAVHGAKTDVGHRMNHTELIADDFIGYDFVMLGDIHKFQYMDPEGTIAYAGSLIQQSHGESLDNHGFIKWDLLDGESQLVKIKNDYGFCTIQIDNGEMIPTKIPLKPTICFLLKNTNDLQFQEILSELKKNYQIAGYLKESYEKWLVPREKNKFNIELSAYNTQEEILLKYLESIILEKSQVDSIINLHKQIYRTIFKEMKVDNHKKQNWSILELTFSNVLSYGKDNIIDFRNFDSNKIIGIMAPNHYGKSAILDIILFCLFDKFSRGERKDILNKNKKNLCCSLLFKIGNHKFMIERIGARSKNGLSVKIDVNFYKINKDDKENLNGIDKNETNRKITDLIGDYNDYLTTCFCLQNGQGRINFLDMTHLQKKEYLHEILKLNVFEDCYHYAKDIFKDLAGQIKILQQSVEKYSLDELKKNAKDLQNDINELRNQKSSREHYDFICLMVEQNNSLNKIDELSRYVLDSEEDIAAAITQITDRINELQNTNVDLSKIKHTIGNLKEELKILETTIKSEINLELLDGHQKKLESYLQNWINIPDSHYDVNIKQLKNDQNDILKRINDIAFGPHNYQSQIISIKEEIMELKKMRYPILQCQCDGLGEKIIQYDNLVEKCNKMRLRMMNQKNISQRKRKELILEKNLRKNFVNHLEESFHELGYLLKCHETWIINNAKWMNITDDLLSTEEIDISLFDIKEKNRRQITEIILTNSDTRWNDQINQQISQLEEKLSDCITRDKEFLILQKEKSLLENNLDGLLKQISQYENYQKNLIDNDILNEKIRIVKGDIKEFKKIRDDIYAKKNELIERIEGGESIIETNKDRINEHQMLKRHLQLLDKYYWIFIDWKRKTENYRYWITKKNDFEFKIKMITKEIEIKEQKLLERKENIRQYIISRKEFDEKSEQLGLYQLYLKIMDYNGLPYEILKKYLPLIEISTNQILHSMVNFSIEFMFHDNSLVEEQKNKFMKSNQGNININICHPDMLPHNVNLASGFERFIIGLAIRMVLGHISLGAKPNFLIIDEGWSCLDSDNLNNIDTILDYIKMQYEHVIIISHLEELKNQVDYSINIEKIRGFSYVNTIKN